MFIESLKGNIDPEGVAYENFKYIRPLQGRKTGIYDFSINIRPLWGRIAKTLTGH
jgi:hypothetical protein